MNTLSWFLYFADVLPNLGSAAGFVVTVSLIFILTPLVFLNAYTYDSGAPERLVEATPTINKWFIFTMIVCSFLWVFIPTKEAIYMIAGSEAGEYVVNTPEAQEILDSIKEVIQLQIEELKPNDSKPAN